MKPTIPELIPALTELFKTAVSLNRPDFTVFVNFSGHIPMVTIWCYPGGWSEAAEASLRRELYVDEHGSIARIQAVEMELKTASEHQGGETPTVSHRVAIEPIQEAVV